MKSIFTCAKNCKCVQMALWSKWIPANWLLCRQRTIRLKPSYVLWSPIAPVTHTVMCVSNLCTRTKFHTTNKPLGRRPTSQVHRVNARDLNLYMHRVDTHSYHILSRKHSIINMKHEWVHVMESLISSCSFSLTTTYAKQQHRKWETAAARKTDIYISLTLLALLFWAT